jgi:hypothetical protein
MSFFENIIQRITGAPGEEVELSDAEIDSLTDEDIRYLQAMFGAHTLMKIPEREMHFFDWLKAEDAPVWDELWEDDADMCVSLAFLENFRMGANGFLICDLEDTDNYFFTVRHIKPDGVAGLSKIIDKAAKGRQLSISEALLFEISVAPIDVWHFCYKHRVPLSRGKAAVADLDSHQWLVHLTKSEDLVKYLEE